ncbi:MAG TPA: PrsW family intramembrane metalloprotease [Propionibacteriaceae bacterium]
MECPRCRAELPEVAHFCHVCGQDMRSGDLARRKSFAAKPDEPVASFALISSIMPRGAGQRPQTYRIALTIALVVALVAAIFGAMPIAVLVAAFAIPIVYIVYIYDVNLWEDEPIPVTGFAFALTGVLAIGFTILWTFLRGAPPYATGSLEGGINAAPSVGTFLLVAIAVPVVGEAIRQVGPVILASRPEFDDLMDGLTFGVISGVAYACFDTIVRHWALLTGGLQDSDPGLWVSLIFLEGFVKPLIFGTATGIACAEFSGLGRGYDGFTPRYFRGLAEAVLANIAYQAGTYLFSFVGDATLGVVLSIGWGLIILGTLILRIRNVLHVGLMEAALERSARDGGVGSSGELEFCAHCEMPLLEHAAFCNACGTAVRVQPKQTRTKVPALAGPAAASESIVPGFDSPVAGEESPPTAQAGEPTGEDPSITENDSRNRSYDEEEGRA